jgi:hypothetical protein
MTNDLKNRYAILIRDHARDKIDLLKELKRMQEHIAKWQQIAIDKLNEKDRYIERLEKDFIFYARSYEYLRDPDKWKPHQERYKKAEQKAQDALNEIRKRKL